MKKTLLLSCLGLLLLVLLYTFKSFTLPIFTDNGIASLRTIEVNKDQQNLLIRGHDRNLPILLFLHGGPGMPAMFMAHDFQRELEKHFVVVHWDQRGAGKSYREDISAEELSISALLSDTDKVVDYLRELLQQDKVWLVGHSHGSYLGILYASENPEKVTAFVGTGQVTHFEREVEVQDAYLQTQLAKLGWSSETEINSSNREELLFQTGSEIYGETSFMPLILQRLKSY
ncbi:MAG: alpha/beta fold hydrolase [Pseudomonadota bacterium]